MGENLNTLNRTNRPTSIGIIKFNARNNSVCSSPARSSYSGARLSYSTSLEPELHFITHNTDAAVVEANQIGGNAMFDSADEADECVIVSSEPEIANVDNTFVKRIDDPQVVEEVGMECNVVRQISENFVLTEAPMNLNKVTFSTDQKQASTGPTNPSELQFIIQQFNHCFQRLQTLPFLRARLLSIAFLIISFFVLPSFLTGLLTGIYLSMITFMFVCVSDPLPKNQPSEQDQHFLMLVSQKSEQKAGKVYKGWMNILNEHYHPHSFHVNTIQTVLVRLDGSILRISRPDRTMLKHCFHIDPTLTEPEPRMVSQDIYDLTGAKVRVRPRRLARRRWFSRKYPICVKLANCNKALERQPVRSRRREANSIQRERNNIDSTTDYTDTSDGEGISTEVPVRHSISEYHLDPDHNSIPQHRRSSPGSPHCSSTATFPTRSDRSSAAGGRYIFLFARSTREKERWFHKLRQASFQQKRVNPNNSNGYDEDLEHEQPKQRHLSYPDIGRMAQKFSRGYMAYMLQSVQFSKQLEEILAGAKVPCEESDNGIVLMDLGRNKWDKSDDHPLVSKEFITLANLIATRVFYDFCRDDYWCGAVRSKIQTKLATIHLPYFIETLELSKLDLGTATPRILKVYNPIIDDWGIWCDFELKYNGMIRLVLETRVNLMKLKNLDALKDDTGEMSAYSTSVLRKTPSRYSDEEIPESPETSPDEDFGSKLKVDNNSKNSAATTSRRQKTGQKLLSLVDKIAHSKYFREASELGPIRKMMEEISSTRLVLNVEVTELEGTMTCNFPPPPSDRLWYGFRTPPHMSIKAVPQVGDRSVVLSTLSEWIEGKLQLILEKNLVLPNMDDVIVPVCSGNELLRVSLNN